jgi:tetratricopeptide (TPR) repeat protein
MSYSLREVSAMLGMTPAQIRSYATKGFLNPERGERGELLFGFPDLVILRTASELTAANIPPRKVKRALEKLREQLPSDRSIAGVRIAADGDQVVVSDGGTVWNAESGQELFNFEVSELAERTTPILRAAADEAEDADDWYELACELELTSLAKAQQAYERALELDPRHCDAHINLGRILHDQGAPAAAEPHYRAAIKSEPDSAIAWFNLGVALEDLGKLKDAVEAYRRAISLDPGNADAHYNLSGILERRGDKPAALRHLKTYRKLTHE